MNLVFVLIFASVCLSGISVFLGLRRSRVISHAMLSEPRCAKCSYDLRGFAGAAPVRCSECGADLTVKHAILWGSYQTKTKGIFWIVVSLAIVPLLLIPMLFVHVRSTVNFPRTLPAAARSNAAVIASLANTANQPWDWQELDQRRAAGKLSNAEVGQAIDKLIAFLNTQPGGQPLSWSDQFLTSADASGSIAPAQYQRLAKTFYKSTQVQIARSIRSGGSLQIRVMPAGPWQLPNADYVYALKSVTCGQTPLKVSSDRNFNGPVNLDYLSATGSFDIFGRSKVDLPPGDYVLTFTVDAAVLTGKSAPQVVDNLPGQANRWPTSRASWTDVITAPLKLVPADQSPIALVTDPAMDPQLNNSITIKSIHVIRRGTGERVTVDLETAHNKIACSLDVFLKIAGQIHAIGQHVAHADGGSGSQSVIDLPSLDASVQTADVVLKPDPKHAEGVPGIDSIWGQEVDLLNVPLQRYDLPAK